MDYSTDMGVTRDSHKPRFQIDALDGFRGLAALIVIFSHTSNLDMFYFPGLDFGGTGKVGVYLFFILSSYLLTRPMLAHPDKVFSLSGMHSYGFRRVMRIFPLYLVFLGVAALATAFPLTVDGTKLYLPFSLTSTEFIDHLFLQQGKGVAWSIPVEFKYYFVLPLFAFIIVKLAASKFYPSAFLILAIFLLAFGIRTLTGEGFVRIHTIYYMEAFLFGALAAVFKHSYDAGQLQAVSKFIPVAAVLGATGLIVTIPSIFSLIVGQDIKPTYFKARIFMSGLFWFPILLLLICERQTVFDRFMAFGVMRFFGKISFSLYLVHTSVLNLILAFGFSGMLGAWLVLIISIAISSLTYALIEKPLSRLKFQKQSVGEH